MKKLLTLASLISLTSAFSANSADLNLTIDNLDNTKGKLMLSIFNSESGYKQDKPIISVLYQPSAKSVKLNFPGLSEGNYAVKVMHDENNNNKLDTNLIGIPSESYGFSNNAGSFGPASFKEAEFVVKDTTTHVISLK